MADGLKQTAKEQNASQEAVCRQQHFPAAVVLRCLGIRICVSAKSLQSCPTLCDPVDCSLPISSVHGIS